MSGMAPWRRCHTAGGWRMDWKVLDGGYNEGIETVMRIYLRVIS